MNVRGVNGQIELHEGKIVIQRKGFMALGTHGLAGGKEILIEYISSIQLKEAGWLTNGYIQFAFVGGQEAKGGLAQAVKDENTVVFNKKQMPEFAQLKTAIEKRIRESKMRTPSLSTTPSTADELTKFAKLRDEGIITEDEFQVKKRELLSKT